MSAEDVLVQPKKKSSLWKQVKETVFFKSKGLTEIHPDHPKHELTRTIRLLLRKHMPETKSRYQLERQDYLNHFTMMVDTKSLNEQQTQPKPRRPITPGKLKRSNKSAATFTVYAPTVFATLRAALGISHEDFLMSAAPEEDIFSPYMQYISNSKGKDSFFFTYDRRFVFKLEKAHTIQTFMDLLEEYLGHFITSPHSLIAKILGAYTIKLRKSKPVHFIVIQSIFWPSSGIQERYDIKGCLGGRYEDPKTAANAEDVVLKDQNFIGMPMNLGKERSWFVEQITRDVRFLQRLKIMDYSLLIGIQSLRQLPDNKAVVADTADRPLTSQSLRSFVSSVKRSSLSFGDRPSLQFFQTNDQDDDESNNPEKPVNISNLVEYLQVKPDGSFRVKESSVDGRPVSDLSLLTDLFQDETQPPTPPRKTIQSALRSSKRGNNNVIKVRQVRFEDKVMQDSLHLVHPVSGVVSPVPSLHFQVHEPPTAMNLGDSDSLKNGHRTSPIEAIRSPLRRLASLSPLKVSNKTGPWTPAAEEVDTKVFFSHDVGAGKQIGSSSNPAKISDTAAADQYEEIWYTDESKPHGGVKSGLSKRLGKSWTSRKKINSIKRSKGFWSDLDRIEVASPHSDTDPSQRRHSIILHEWLQAWQNLNGAENRRLLPDSPNGVQILDGVTNRYYFGIIDIFTEYSFRQKIGRVLKSLLYCSWDHSSVPPEEYASRFVEFVEEHLT